MLGDAAPERLWRDLDAELGEARTLPLDGRASTMSVSENSPRSTIAGRVGAETIVSSWRPRAAVVLGSIAVGVAALIAFAAIGDTVVGVAAVIASVPLSLRIGPRQHDECADPQCAAIVPSDVDRRPECQASLAGRIEHRNQRLDAAEEYLSSVR